MRFLRARPRVAIAAAIIAGLVGLGGLGVWLLIGVYAHGGKPVAQSPRFSSSPAALPSASASGVPTDTASATASAEASSTTSAPGANASGLGPAARDAFQMAYDGATRTTVLFGGTATGNSAEPLGDTWIWDGAKWDQQHPASSPPSRALGSLAYDDATGQLVLFGGLTTGGRAVNDTWTWDGSTWTEQHPSSSPTPRMEANMAYDDTIRAIVLFAGQNGTFFTDTWEWDGANWTQVSTRPAAPNPTSNAYSSMAYHAGTQRLVFLDSANESGKAHTWVFDGQTWLSSGSPVEPGWRIFESLARFDWGGTVVMFGGSNGGSFLDETWTFNGAYWLQQHPDTSPPARNSGGAAIMAYDAAHHEVVLFGGIGAANHLLGDTWTWDGTTWTLRAE